MVKPPVKRKRAPAKTKKATAEVVVGPIDVVPTGDADSLINAEDTDEASRNRLELAALNAEANLKKYQNREVKQRYLLKWIATGLGLIVILGMALMLRHMTHQMFWGPLVLINPALSVVLVLGPILPITGITIALFIGAFRKFEDGDIEAVSANALSAARVIR